MTAHKKIVVFTCNWNAYHGMESAGAQRLRYSPSIIPIKVNCLGQISSGLILKALQERAGGVLLLGCPPGECHFVSGNLHAEEILTETRRLAKLLGYHETQVVLDWIAQGSGETFVQKVHTMLSHLKENQTA